MTAVLQEARVQLEPVAPSVRQARLFVRSILAENDREQWSEPAELAVSEVVTNAILHAHTRLELTVRVLGQELQVEVLDGSSQLPFQRTSDTSATTGRGLDLVAAVTADHGVRPMPAGKVVWFVVRGVSPDATDVDLLDQWDTGSDWTCEEVMGNELPGGGVPGDHIPANEADRLVEVVLQGLPAALWLAAGKHHDALLREYVLYSAEHPVAHGPAALALADEGRRWLRVPVRQALERTELAPSALAAETPRLDLTVQVPAGSQSAFLALQDVLDEAEQLATTGRLLVSTGLLEVVALRDWACEQVVAQLAGVPPGAWPAVPPELPPEALPDQVRRVDASEPELAVLLASERAVVAADDANRIVAVSMSLAALLGWRPADLIGRRLVTLVPSALREAHVAGFTRHLVTGRSQLLGQSLTLPVLHSDGTELDCEVLIEQTETAAGRTLYVGWFRPLER